MAALHQPQLNNTSMRTRRVDIVASLLGGSLIVVGSVVLLLAALWMLAGRQVSRLLDPLPIGVSATVGTPFPASSPIELPMEVVLEPEKFEDQLSSVVLIASAVIEADALAHDSLDSEGLESARGLGIKGAGIGPEGAVASGIPAFERWQIIFEATDLEDYARQLDFFGIELGCVGGGIETVDYASAFSSAVTTRQGAGTAERRLYFAWREQNVLASYDRALLKRAEVVASGRLTLRFISSELEQQLLQLELEHAGKSGIEHVEEIRRTAFRSQRIGSGYRFVVASQEVQRSRQH